MSLDDLIPRSNLADQLWQQMGRRLAKSIDEAMAAGDSKAAQYFTAKRGSPSVYVPFGFHAAKLLNVDMVMDAHVSARGEGFEAHKKRIAKLVDSYNLASFRWEEKCGLDLCLAHPETQQIHFAYEAEMSKLPTIPMSAARCYPEVFQESDEKQYYMNHLKDLDKLLQINCTKLFYLGSVQNNNWKTELPKLRCLIETRARRTLEANCCAVEASCCRQRKLMLLLTTGRKRKGVTEGLFNMHYAVGVWSDMAFSWTDDMGIL